MLTKNIIPTFIDFLRGGTVSSSGDCLVERYKKVCSCASATTPSWMSLGDFRGMLQVQQCELIQSTSTAKEWDYTGSCLLCCGTDGDNAVNSFIVKMVPLCSVR